MGVKFAVAMGAEVTIFSASPSKEQDAKRLGAHHFVLSTNKDAMRTVAGSFDLILDTVAAKHEIMPFLFALAPHGVFAVVGAPPDPMVFNAFGLIGGNRSIYGEYFFYCNSAVRFFCRRNEGNTRDDRFLR